MAALPASFYQMNTYPKPDSCPARHLGLNRSAAAQLVCVSPGFGGVAADQRLSSLTQSEAAILYAVLILLLPFQHLQYQISL